MTLRAYQTKWNADIEAEFTRGRRSVVGVMPTGGGKTVCFVDTAGTISGRYGAPVLIAAHRVELINQAKAKLLTAGVPVIPLFEHRGFGAHVGSVAALGNRLGSLPRYSRIIIDEAHHSTAATYLRLIESQPRAQIQGVTATPERLDGRGLGDVFDSMVEGPSYPDLLAGGYICPVRVYGPPDVPDLSQVRTIAGEWSASGIAKVMDVPKLTGDAADEYLWHCGGQPAIAFCATVAHAEHVAADFRRLGWRFEAVHGDLPADVRAARLAGLADGSLHGLTTCDLIGEGVDIVSVACVILLTKTKSLSKYLQWIGRGLRLAAGKAYLIVLDHAGNVMHHGLPDIARRWSLEGRPKKIAPPAIRQCESCFAVFAPAPACPCCGQVIAGPVAAAPKRGAATTRAGELALMSPEDRRLAEGPLRALIKESKGYTALLTLARARGLPDSQAQKWLEGKARYRARMVSGA